MIKTEQRYIHAEDLSDDLSDDYSDNSDDDLIVSNTSYSQFTGWSNLLTQQKICLVVVALSGVGFVISLIGTIINASPIYSMFDQRYDQPADLERVCIKWSCRHELPTLSEIDACIDKYHKQWASTHEIYKFFNKLKKLLTFQEVYTYSGNHYVITVVVLYVSTTICLLALLCNRWINKKN